MIKKSKQTIQVDKIIITKFCDDCGKELTGQLSCSKAVCLYCGKDLCEDCIGNEEDDGCSSRTVYCKTCWNIGGEYRPAIQKIEDQIDRLYKEWQSKCKHDKNDTVLDQGTT